MKDGPLDMRMDNSQGPTAAEWLVNIEEEALANVIFQYGEERYSRRIAKAIKAAGYIDTTAKLAEIVKVAHPKWEKINMLPPGLSKRFVLLLIKN